MHQYTSLPVWLDVARSILADGGHDPEAVFERLGVEPQRSKKDQVERADVAVIGRVWREVSLLTQNQYVGLDAVSTYFQPAHWQTLGLSILCSNSLVDAFNRLARYSSIISDVVVFTVYESPEAVELELTFREDFSLLGDEATDYGFASLLQLLRMIYPGKLNPLSVELPRSPLSGERFEDFFGCPVTYNAERVCFSFSQSVAKLQLPVANAELAEYQDRLSEDYKLRFGNSSFSLKVKDEILRQLPGGEPTPKTVAAALLTSVRNQQRKLSAEGTSFSLLLSEIRMTLAKEYLQQPYRTCNEVAYMLGFSDHSNFTRAFRRCYGQTPTQYRDEVLGE